MSGVREAAAAGEEDDLNADGAPNAERADIEARARRAGWRPQGEYKGQADRWVDADAFLQIAEEEMPVLKERNRHLDRKVGQLTRNVEQTNAMLHELRQMASKSEERAYERAKLELQQQQRAAVESGDAASYDSIAGRLEALEKEKPKPAPAPVPVVNEDVQELHAWVGKQAWWNTDTRLTKAVTDMHSVIMQSNPGMSQMDALQKTIRVLKEDYPDQLGVKKPVPAGQEEGEGGNPLRDQPSTVGSSQLGAGPARRRGKPTKISDLPREDQPAARTAFAKFQRGMKDFTEEEYVSNFLDQ